MNRLLFWHPWWSVAGAIGVLLSVPWPCGGQESQIQAGELPPPVTASPHYRLHTWITDEGLPQNTVNALAQTPDGYLWIGTVFGLVRFDGVQFVTFDEKNTPALLSHTV